MIPIQDVQPNFAEKIENALKSDDQLTLGSILDLKETGQKNTCYRIYTATVEINVAIPIKE